MKERVAIIVVLCSLFLLIGCHNEPHHKLQGRLDDFVVLLDSMEKSYFNKKAYQQAADRFDKRVSSNKSLADSYQQIKEKENILIFSTVQVFRFFGDTMRKKIAFYKNLKNSK